MEAKRGSRIVVESERVGAAEREGEVLEVIQGEVGIRYRVRWSDGRETTFTPAGGSVRIAAASTRAGARKKAGAGSPRKEGGKAPTSASKP